MKGTFKMVEVRKIALIAAAFGVLQLMSPGTQLALVSSAKADASMPAWPSDADEDQGNSSDGGGISASSDGDSGDGVSDYVDGDGAVSNDTCQEETSEGLSASRC